VTDQLSVRNEDAYNMNNLTLDQPLHDRSMQSTFNENLNRTAIGLPVKKTFLNFMKGEQKNSIAEAVSTSAHGSSLDQGKGSMGSGIINEYGGERGRN